MNYNAFEKQTDIRVAHAQVVYLAEVIKMNYTKIAEITGYAISTCRNYARKYFDLLEWAKEIFTGKIRQVFNLKTKGSVVYECAKIADGVPTAYLTEIYNGEKFLFTKIGFSAHVPERMKRHANNKKYGEGNTVIVKHCFVFDDKEQALSMENCLRKFFKERNNCADYVKQDRFTEQKVTDEIVEMLASKAEFIRTNL